MDNKKTKVLLIGGTGVLSTDIREYSIKKGYDVYILNRGHNKVETKAKNIIADIRKKEETKKIIQDYSFDVVFDFLSFDVNQLSNTLEIIKGKCKQFVFISSATAYRKTDKGEKIKEDYELVNEDWEYADNKIKCENYLRDNYKRFVQEYTIIRPYVTYSDTRIPFAIIPSNKQWSLVYRILNNKPIVLWDNGKAMCTLTSSKDFAVGAVGLINNEKAYNNDFHITTDYILTWKEALTDIGKATNKDVIVASIPTDFIVKIMPEYKGVLYGDKNRNREFCNDKIKDAVPEFNAKIKFEDGIKETIKNYESNENMQRIDFEWDARIDRMIYLFGKKNNINYSNLCYCGDNASRIDKMTYYLCRHNFTYFIFKVIRKIKHFF